MSPEVALAVVTWIALIVVYLGLAAVLRDVRLLRNELTALKAGRAGPQTIGLTMPALAPETGASRVVLVADAGCPSCQRAAEELAGVSETLPSRPALLTYEAPQEWSHVSTRLAVTQDGAAWSSLSHLSPPILLLVGPGGTVRELTMLTDSGVARVLASWGVSSAAEGK
jgi:hypothetical protein